MFEKIKKIRKHLMLIAVAVGVISGVGSFVFHFLIMFFTQFFLKYFSGFYPPSAPGDLEVNIIKQSRNLLPLFLIPAIGGMISGIIVYTLAPETEGHGTDAIIRAFHQVREKVRGRVPIIKTIASAITIGSGGSAGREGPMVQIGAGFGAFVASLLGLSDRDRRILLACGAAGGIGSIFQTPLGGALFGVEVLYKEDYEFTALIPAFISSFTGYTVFMLILNAFRPVEFGIQHIFVSPQVRTYSWFELILYALLGLTAGLFALLYIKTFYGVRGMFKKFNIPNHFKPMIGGLITGIIGMFFPYALGLGYGYVQQALDGKLDLATLLLFPFAKILTTAFTIGSGGSGGVFGPSVVMGSMIGGGLGKIFNYFLPSIVPKPECYVPVGMAAFIAAACKTPIAAILMSLEMTGSYNILPALIIASAIAYKVTGQNTIYIEQVRTRVDSPAHRYEIGVGMLEKIRVKDAMQTNIVTVKPTQTVDDVMKLIRKTGHMGYPVVGKKLVGIVTFSDLQKVPVEKRKETKVEEVMTKDLVVVTPEETLESALRKLIERDIGRLPVVVGDKLVGILTRTDIIRAYVKWIYYE